VDVTVGTPAGKTKTILVSLEGKLPPGSRRLRLKEAFEIYWDRIALMEVKPAAWTKITTISPARPISIFAASAVCKTFRRIGLLPRTTTPLVPIHIGLLPGRVVHALW
jgi:hypothetical protein